MYIYKHSCVFIFGSLKMLLLNFILKKVLKNQQKKITVTRLRVKKNHHRWSTRAFSLVQINKRCLVCLRNLANKEKNTDKHTALLQSSNTAQ